MRISRDDYRTDADETWPHSRVLEKASSRLLKTIQMRCGILVIVSVQTWSIIPNEHEHVPTNTNSSEAIERQRSIWVFFSSVLGYFAMLLPAKFSRGVPSAFDQSSNRTPMMTPMTISAPVIRFLLDPTDANL